jgi:hypothetical protein
MEALPIAERACRLDPVSLNARINLTETTGGQGYHFIGISLFNCTTCYVMSQQVRLNAPAGSRVRVGSVGSELRVPGLLDRRGVRLAPRRPTLRT